MTDSKRVRLPRKAAATVSYAEQADALTDNDDDDEAVRLERERAAKRKKADKGKQKDEKAQQPVKPQEPGDAYLWRPVPAGIMSKAVKGQLAAYAPKRVDPTTVLPSEIILEIFSYLRPIALWRMLYLNKRIYALLTSTSGLALWHAAIKATAAGYSVFRVLGIKRPNVAAPPLPSDDGRPVKLIKIAALLFREDCQMCGEGGCSAPLGLLLRMCEDCEGKQLVSLLDVRKDDAFIDLHPETLNLVKTTDAAPGQPYKKRPFALRSEIHRVNEELEDLQILDDAQYRSARPAVGSSRRAVGSSRTRQAESSNADESPITSAVAKYVIERKTRLEEVKKITQWCRDRGGRQYVKPQIADDANERSEYDKRVRKFRREAILERIRLESPFDVEVLKLMAPDWHRHPDIHLSQPLSNEEWKAIGPRINAGFGCCVAYNVLSQHGLQDSSSSSDQLEGRMGQALKQPNCVDDAVWALVRPQILMLVEERKAQVLAEAAARALRTAEMKRFAKIQVKEAFFRARLDSIRAAQTNEAAQAALPILTEFVLLPSVSALYHDAEFATDEARRETDLATWTEHVDAVHEEIDDYKVQVRLEALQSILAATTNMSVAAIENIDADALLDSRFDDEFFSRPSSWAVCSLCAGSSWAQGNFGPLPTILKHRHDRHASRDPPSPAGLPRPASTAKGPGAPTSDRAVPAFVSPVKLPLEFACVILSICELSGLDANDSTVSPEDLEEIFEESRFVWRNAGRGRTSRRTCLDLIHSVIRDASSAELEGKVLPVPDIARRTLKWRERGELLEARLRKAAASNNDQSATRDSDFTYDASAQSVEDEDNENEDDEDEDEELARSWMDAGSEDENTVDGLSGEDIQEDGDETSE